MASWVPYLVGGLPGTPLPVHPSTCRTRTARYRSSTQYMSIWDGVPKLRVCRVQETGRYPKDRVTDGLEAIMTRHLITKSGIAVGLIGPYTALRLSNYPTSSRIGLK